MQKEKPKQKKKQMQMQMQKKKQMQKPKQNHRRRSCLFPFRHRLALCPFSFLAHLPLFAVLLPRRQLVGESAVTTQWCGLPPRPDDDATAAVALAAPTHLLSLFSSLPSQPLSPLLFLSFFWQWGKW
ncbi:uncharacterized protein DS421_3g100340 [Arachis hypogaea]|nr:uncharacterized protein DS421_3g100340 [Arachis hypogaea]